MTRFLSEALNAREPYFRHGLRGLESANGNPSTDIRFTNEVTNLTRSKYRHLGLDSSDSTAEELYHALLEKVRQDDAVLTRTLRTLSAARVSAEAEPVAGMVEALRRQDSGSCYAIKTSHIKAIIKANPPKKLMKQLGFRSVDSMLRTESPALVIAAAWIGESSAWQKRLISQYRRLSPTDFEERPLALVYPPSQRWQDFMLGIVKQTRHNLITVKELGTLVMLPLPHDAPAGSVTASLCLAIHEINEIKASSTFLKLNQVRPDFGDVLADIIVTEPVLSSKLLDKPMPWKLIQRYYSKVNDYFREDIFEPYIRLEDMVWQPVEKRLVEIEPKLGFWLDNAHLGIVEEAKAVSLNVIDSALNLCNSRSFENRINNHFQRSLLEELLVRYLNRGPLEQTILSELQPKYVLEEINL